MQNGSGRTPDDFPLFDPCVTKLQFCFNGPEIATEPYCAFHTFLRFVLLCRFLFRTNHGERPPSEFGSKELGLWSVF